MFNNRHTIDYKSFIFNALIALNKIKFKQLEKSTT